MTSPAPLPSTGRPLVAVNLKAYFSVAQTRRWLAEVVRLAAGTDRAEVAVTPSFPMIWPVAQLLSGTTVRWGAQDVAPSEAGAQTGLVKAGVLAELGCTYVVVGHAEQRARGDDDEVINAKLSQVRKARLVPILCVGERIRGSPQIAARTCRTQLDRLDIDPDQPLVIGYEPVWSIGAAEPADPEHINTVCQGIREHQGLSADTRVIYGGSAGSGLWATIRATVDGLFLGRRAHEPADFATVLAEVTAADPTALPRR